MKSMPKPQSLRTTLEAARDLIQNPEHWLKYGGYRDGQRFSAQGALCHVDGPFEAQADIHLRFRLPEDFVGSIQDFNDDLDTTHKDILAWFDRAIRS